MYDLILFTTICYLPIISKNIKYRKLFITCTLRKINEAVNIPQSYQQDNNTINFALIASTLQLKLFFHADI